MDLITVNRGTHIELAGKWRGEVLFHYDIIPRGTVTSKIRSIDESIENLEAGDPGNIELDGEYIMFYPVGRTTHKREWVLHYWLYFNKIQTAILVLPHKLVEFLSDMRNIILTLPIGMKFMNKNHTWYIHNGLNTLAKYNLPKITEVEDVEKLIQLMI
jgi:hypothetical protein